MSWLHDQLDWLHSTLKTNAGESATYTDASSGTSFAITVPLGQTIFTSGLENAARFEWSELDILVLADDLTVNGSMIEPARGDSIAITLNGAAITLEIMTPSNGDRPWRYSGAYRDKIRIHCKRVA